MRTYTSTYRYRTGASAALAAGLLITGCSAANTSGTPAATTSAGGEWDPCNALTISDLDGRYLRSSLPFALTRGIDDGAYPASGFASCRYGTWDQIGVTLNFPLGELPDDFGDLVSADYRPGAERMQLGNGDHAVYLSEAGQTRMAVQHGDVQFVLEWQPIESFASESLSRTKMSELAELVASRLPTELTIGDQYPEECGDLPGVEDIVGDSTITWGSADVDNLYCDVLGPDGLLTAAATKQAPEWVEDRIEASRGLSPEDEVEPAIAEDVLILAADHQADSGGGGQLHGLRVDGYLRMCCQMHIEYFTPDDALDMKRSPQFDSTEREFVTAFVDTARTWVSH